MGPFPRSKNGHTTLLVSQDRFSEWVEIEPLRKATTAAVICHLELRIVCRHGCSRTLTSDNGKQFSSHKLREFLEKNNIQHHPSPVYTPHCNPVERANRTLKIRQCIGKNHRRWDENLAALQFALNTAQQTSIGYIPAYINNGRELRIPASSDEQGESLPPATRAKHLQEAYELVRINLAQAFQRQGKYFDQHRREWRPRESDTVWKREHPLSNKAQAFTVKFASRYTGPFIIMQVKSPVIVDISLSLSCRRAVPL